MAAGTRARRQWHCTTRISLAGCRDTCAPLCCDTDELRALLQGPNTFCKIVLALLALCAGSTTANSGTSTAIASSAPLAKLSVPPVAFDLATLASFHHPTTGPYIDPLDSELETEAPSADSIGDFVAGQLVGMLCVTLLLHVLRWAAITVRKPKRPLRHLTVKTRPSATAAGGHKGAWLPELEARMAGSPPMAGSCGIRVELPPHDDSFAAACHEFAMAEAESPLLVHALQRALWCHCGCIALILDDIQA
jgi:hypothetical protein